MADIAPADMHIIRIALRYNKPNKTKNHKNIMFIHIICSLNENKAAVLFLGF